MVCGGGMMGWCCECFVKNCTVPHCNNNMLRYACRCKVMGGGYAPRS
jgi:hypothetical protein